MSVRGTTDVYKSQQFLGNISNVKSYFKTYLLSRGCFAKYFGLLFLNYLKIIFN